MGVYISGLEIPPKGKGAVVILCSSGAVYSGGQKVGTAVPVPPHGRLIDADALMQIIREHDYPLKAHFNSTDNGMFTIGIQQAVDEAPTIIPADPAEEGEI